VNAFTRSLLIPLAVFSGPFLLWRAFLIWAGRHDPETVVLLAVAAAVTVAGTVAGAGLLGRRAWGAYLFGGTALLLSLPIGLGVLAGGIFPGFHDPVVRLFGFSLLLLLSLAVLALRLGWSLQRTERGRG
jgi:hypothetical protein